MGLSALVPAVPGFAEMAERAPVEDRRQITVDPRWGRASGTKSTMRPFFTLISLTVASTLELELGPYCPMALIG